MKYEISFEGNINIVLDNFATIYSDMTSISKEEIIDMCKRTITFYKGKDEHNPLEALHQYWFDGQEEGVNLYDVYGHRDYYAEVFACWYIYSQKYLKSIFTVEKKNPNLYAELNLKSVKSIIDFGNGLGFTSLMLARHFKDAKVYGTNLKDTLQWKFCEATNKDREYELIQDYSDLGHIDMIFASEYFEHIDNALEHIEHIIDKTSPNIVVVANSFNTRGIGHLYSYNNYGTSFSQEKMSKLFINKMKQLGYRKQKTGFWNESPNVYIKNNLNLF